MTATATNSVQKQMAEDDAVNLRQMVEELGSGVDIDVKVYRIIEGPGCSASSEEARPSSRRFARSASVLSQASLRTRSTLACRRSGR